LYYAAAKQVLLPPGDPLIGNLNVQYLDSIHSSMQNGHLNVGGLAGGGEYPLLYKWKNDFANQDGKKVFLKMIYHYPTRYAAGVARSFCYFCGFPGLESDNATFGKLALENGTGAVFLGGAPGLKGL